MKVEALCHSNRATALDLLARFAETSILLRTGLDEYGPRLTAQLNSANYKCLVDREKAVAVFALTRRGNLCVETVRASDYSSWILEACAEEPLALRGFLGEWPTVQGLLTAHVQRVPRFVTSFSSKEVLLKLDIESPSARSHHAGLHVRSLELADHDEWDALSRAFSDEEGLPIQGTAEQRLEVFATRVQRRAHWGLFHEGRLASTATLTAQIDQLSQIGGVFTTPRHRRKGFSRAVMQRLIDEGHGLGIRRLILFTGEHNHPARALYDVLGFEQSGSFGLIFGEEQ